MEKATGEIVFNGFESRMRWINNKGAFRAGMTYHGWDPDFVLTGSITVTQGSTVLVGTGTQFSSEIVAGDILFAGQGPVYPSVPSYSVKEVNSDTQLTLYHPALGDFSGLATVSRVGIASTAFGIGAKASNFYSMAAGDNVTASGVSSVAMGAFTSASGDAAVATGLLTAASGAQAIVMGERTIADDDNSLVIGEFNDTAGDNYFVVGNGSFNPADTDRSNALVLNKKGDLGLGIGLPANRLHVEAGPAANNGFVTNSYVALIRNTNDDVSADVLAIQTGARNKPGYGANLIGFFDGDGNLFGQIEGNGSGGVAYTTTGADYAEYLPYKYPGEALEAADVVGVFGGRISHKTRDADQLLVITDRAAVLGNTPLDREDTENYKAVS